MITKRVKALLAHVDEEMKKASCHGEIAATYREAYPQMRHLDEKRALYDVYKRHDARYPLPSQRRIWVALHRGSHRRVVVARPTVYAAWDHAARLLGIAPDEAVAQIELRQCIDGAGGETSHMEYVQIDGRGKSACAFCGGRDPDVVESYP